MKNLLLRLSSRTFWVAVGTIVTLCANKMYDQAAAVASAYILGEKAVDTFSNRPSVLPGVEIDESQNIGEGPLVTGTGRVQPDNEEKPGLETGL